MYIRPASDWPLDVSRGAYLDRVAANISGRNDNVGSTNFEVVWTPGDQYPWPTVAQTVRVAPGGALVDTATGTGARTVFVDGLDENWDPVSTILTLAGAAASLASSKLFIRVNRVVVVSCGTYGGTNAENVNIEHTASTDVVCVCAAGASKSEQALYSVRDGYDAFIVDASTRRRANQIVAVRVLVRPDADVVTPPCSPALVIHQVDDMDPFVRWDPQFFESVPPRSDLWVEAKATAGPAGVTANFEIVLVRQNSSLAPVK